MFLPAQTLVATPVFAGASPNCPGWNSTTRPPDYIRVLRRQSGRVDRVPIKKYVLTVLGKEWPGYLPQQVINAGALAVKQYAWYHSLGNGRVSNRGQCFDVTDGVGDQLYKPGKARIRQDHYTALNATWGVRLVKNGSLFMTGYRTGNKGACGYDATGWKLYARSATRCAYRGDGYQQILRIYYGPVSVSGSGSSSGAQTSAMSVSQNDQATDTTPAADSKASTSSQSTDSTDQTQPTDTAAQPTDTTVQPTDTTVQPTDTTVQPTEPTDTIAPGVLEACAGLTGGVGMADAAPVAPVVPPNVAPGDGVPIDGTIPIATNWFSAA
jgi:hypothetical protein